MWTTRFNISEKLNDETYLMVVYLYKHTHSPSFKHRWEFFICQPDTKLIETSCFSPVLQLGPSVRTPAWPSEKTKAAAADLYIIASRWHHQTEELLLKWWNNMDSGNCRRTSKYCIDKHTPRPVGWWKTEMLQVIQEKATRQTGGKKNAGRMNRFF